MRRREGRIHTQPPLTPHLLGNITHTQEERGRPPKRQEQRKEGSTIRESQYKHTTCKALLPLPSTALHPINSHPKRKKYLTSKEKHSTLHTPVMLTQGERIIHNPSPSLCFPCVHSYQTQYMHMRGGEGILIGERGKSQPHLLYLSNQHDPLLSYHKTHLTTTRGTSPLYSAVRVSKTPPNPTRGETGTYPPTQHQETAFPFLPLPHPFHRVTIGLVSQH